MDGPFAPDIEPPLPLALRKRVRNAEGVFSVPTDCLDTLFFSAAPKLRVLSQMAAGVDNINLAEATRRGIPVGYTPGVPSKATAELAFTLLLATARRVVESVSYVRRGEWKQAMNPFGHVGTEVTGTNIGIIGMGSIGQEMVKRALGFDMNVMYHSRTRKAELERRYGITYVDLPDLLSNADFVTLHVPLTIETYHLIGKRVLAMMKPTAILINSSRGQVVDTQALYRAIIAGRLAGAGLDVTDPEPISPNHPLLKLDNVVVTPHIGSAGVRTRREMALLAARNLLAGLRGEPLEHCANREVYATTG